MAKKEGPTLASPAALIPTKSPSIDRLLWGLSAILLVSMALSWSPGPVWLRAVQAASVLGVAGLGLMARQRPERDAVAGLSVSATAGFGTSPMPLILLLGLLILPAVAVGVVAIWRWAAVVGITQGLFSLHPSGAAEVPWGPWLATAALTAFAVWLAVERRADQRQLERLRAELRDQSRQTVLALQHRSEFVTNMSHELRTPLSGILGLVELTQDGPVDPTQQRHLHLIKDSTRSLLAIVDDLLDVGRIESGALRLHPGPVDIGQLTERALGSLAPRAAAKGLTLGCRIDPQLPACLKADPTRIRQVLVNLVGNGIKFTEKGRVDVRVHWSASDSRLRFEVQDTGIGIAPMALPRLFAPFQQADSSTSRQFGGNGLGLSISKRLVELMGGTIGVDSRRGEGSTFWFELPLVVLRSAEAADRTELETEGRLAGARVLVVEDEPVNRLVVISKLESFGLEVTSVEDGRQALDRLAEDVFDLVIMDCQIPVIDGYETTRRMRRSEGPQASVPVVALTAHSHSDERGRCLAAGMNDYLTKPVDTEDLFKTLENWLAQETTPVVPPEDPLP